MTSIDLEYEDGTRKSQSSILIEIGDQQYLFHDQQRQAYALVDDRECLLLESGGFKDFLQREHYRLTGKGANRNAITDAISTLGAKAKYDGTFRQVYLRVAFHDERLYIDLCDDHWRVVEIDGEGWRVLDKSPVMFTRPATAKPLPVPLPGGSIDFIKHLINVREDRWPLVYGFVLSCFAPAGPYPHIAFVGEHGTGKTQASKILRAMIDPSTVPMKSAPKDEEQVVVAAINNWLVGLDNLSGIKPEVSDALCRLSTGGGLSKRKLYSDAEEFTIDVQRPAILNGIDDIATRPDLAERTVTLELEPIERVIVEREIWEEVEAAGPGFLGAVCDALSAGLTCYETTVLKDPPRMADAATWVQSCEMVSGLEVGAFLKAFRLNQLEAVQMTLEANAVASAVMKMMDTRKHWEGTPTELLEFLAKFADEDTRKSKAWPKTPTWLTRGLRRYGKSLRAIGIDFKHDRSSESRNVTLTAVQATKNSVTSVTSVIDPGPNDGNDSNDAKNRYLHGTPPSENLTEDWPNA